MAEEKHEPYPLEPEDGAGAARGEGTGREGEERKGKIESPGLLSEFPEDADFDRDPEVDRAILGPEKPERAGEDVVEEVGEPFVRPGFPDAKVLAIAGGVLLLSAMIATGVNAPDRTVARILLTLYNALLHTGTGVVALFAAAVLLERRLGAFEVAAARMFTAVAAFSLVFSLHINLLGEGYEHWKVEELLLAVVVYALLVAGLFRLWEWRPLVYVIGSHFFLWLVVYVGMQLAAFVQAASAAV